MPIESKITTLIDKFDTVEIVRDTIAAILVVEVARQQELALEDGKNPDLWKVRVFTGRSNPWEEYRDQDDSNDNRSFPIVNVSTDSGNFDRKTSNVVERQTTKVTFNIDCYGVGVATDTSDGHDVGDAKAEFEATRCYRLVRNILMSSHWTHLGMRGVVGERFPNSFKVYQPSFDAKPGPHVIGVRLQLEVSFNEFSPQYQGETMTLVSVTVTRSGTGQVLLRADYPIEE